MKLSSPASFAGGVNRQALSTRPAPGITDAENVDFSPLRGATKRAPSLNVAKLTTAGFDRTKSSQGLVWEHSSGTRYGCLIQPGQTPVVFNADTGANIAVSLKAGTANYNYLGSVGDDASRYRLVPAGDYLIVALTGAGAGTALASTAEAAKATQSECLVHCLRGNYDRTYSVTVVYGGLSYTGSYTTKGTFGAGNAIDTTAIATALAVAITAALAAPSAGAVTAASFGSTIRITGTGAANVTAVSVQDTDGDTSMTTLWDYVESVDRLPVVGYHGYRCRVSGAGDSNVDDFWVKFIADDPTNKAFGPGRWEESMPYGLNTALDATTMPHALERYLSGGNYLWRWTVLPWALRTVGDNDTGPFPSFIRGLNGAAPTYAAHAGEAIDDIAFWQNRLWLLAGSSIIASEANNPFNLFRTSTRQVVPSDRIDITSLEAVRFTSFSAHNEAALLRGRRNLFALTYDGVVSPNTMNLNSVAAVEADTAYNCFPESNGRSVYYPLARGDHGALAEVVSAGDGVRFASQDITLALPDWIGRIKRIESDPGSEAIFLCDAATPSKVYSYRYLWSGAEKAWTAWSSYTFSADVMAMGVLGSLLYLVSNHTDGYYLETLSTVIDANDTGSTFRAAIDRRVPTGANLTVTYDGTTNRTTFTLPYQIETGDVLQVVTTDGTEFPVVAQSTGPGAAAFCRVFGNKSAATVYCGVRYTGFFEIEQPVLHNQDGYAEMDPPSILLSGTVHFNNSGPFTVVVTPDVGATFESQYSSSLGGAFSFVGSYLPTSGAHTFSVRSKEDEVKVRFTSTGPIPFGLTGVSWTHRKFSRGRGTR